MAGLLDTIVDLAHDMVAAGGYGGLGAAILIESVFPPIPSELVLPLAGSLVARAEMTFGGAVLAATAGSLAGALLLYGIARAGGRPLLLRHGRLLRVTARDLDRADAWFDRHGGWIVLGARLVPGVRSLVSIPAGLSGMPVGRFALLTTAGSAAWNAALIGAGWALGARYRDVEDVLGPAAEVTVLVVAAAVLATATWWVRRPHDDAAAAQPGARSDREAA